MHTPSGKTFLENVVNLYTHFSVCVQKFIIKKILIFLVRIFVFQWEGIKCHKNLCYLIFIFFLEGGCRRNR